jgi:hypothetical protein
VKKCSLLSVRALGVSRRRTLILEDAGMHVNRVLMATSNRQLRRGTRGRSRCMIRIGCSLLAPCLGGRYVCRSRTILRGNGWLDLTTSLACAELGDEGRPLVLTPLGLVPLTCYLCPYDLTKPSYAMLLSQSPLSRLPRSMLQERPRRLFDADLAQLRSPLLPLPPSLSSLSMRSRPASTSSPTDSSNRSRSST